MATQRSVLHVCHHRQCSRCKTLSAVEVGAVCFKMLQIILSSLPEHFSRRSMTFDCATSQTGVSGYYSIISRRFASEIRHTSVLGSMPLKESKALLILAACRHRDTATGQRNWHERQAHRCRVAHTCPGRPHMTLGAVSTRHLGMELAQLLLHCHAR